MSGVALNLLIEQDNNRLSVTTNSIRKAVKEVAKKVLDLYRKYAKNKRLARISGENGQIELRSFTGSDITSDDIRFDVENESVGSAAARQNLVEELLRIGIFRDEDGRLSDANRIKILEIMGFGNWENVLNERELHLQKAEKENDDMKKSEVAVDENDAHDLHVTAHVKRLITLDGKDAQAERLRAHIRRHKQLGALVREADKLND